MQAKAKGSMPKKIFTDLSAAVVKVMKKKSNEKAVQVYPFKYVAFKMKRFLGLIIIMGIIIVK